MSTTHVKFPVTFVDSPPRVEEILYRDVVLLWGQAVGVKHKDWLVACPKVIVHGFGATIEGNRCIASI